ncbi:MAG: hypothetical protein EPO35_05010 [Acidobacteria bacterium]|nr:MAG: hypothetical protein EPO35_05010 [Acidobacteriota bacterium]
MLTVAPTETLMNLPLFLSYQGAIIGKGFIAQIDARMKVLGRRDSSGTILIGVVPADVVASGADLDEAHSRLRDRIRGRLVEFARQEATFPAFEKAVRQFCESVDLDEERTWNKAVEVVRAQRDVALLGIPLVKAESEPFINITQKSAADLTPDLNEPPKVEPMSGAANVGLAAVA